ncbi:alpha/beta fold hydrolase [Conyzicola nivalis]|uniref:Microsomal epoxide hydrolase n=1 Tax=Conyzicola nivalis TaxID=1477021 RepID=A0A916SNN7_9MICO|nr:epoxide hydrolase family protein [Conyzicola nivalis]GGB09141.1 microsomal epoxide hydrolase [Conyzicola nivalis]
MRPFRIQIPDAELEELGRRLDAARWPVAENEPGWASGVPRGWLERLSETWRTGYDWRAREARLNSHPQVLVEAAGLDVHAVVLGQSEVERPAIVLTHGWPGTFAEYLEVARRLADPASYGGDAGDAMTVVVPSLPGYGFSGIPAETGWGVERVADAWVELMAALGFEQFFAAGSDWGTSVSAELGRRHPQRILGLTLIPPLAPPDPATASHSTAAETRALERLQTRGAEGSAYSAVHATRPQTIAYALADSPLGLLAWIGEKYAQWAGVPGVADVDILDAASIYWFTRTAGTSARLYRESIDDVSRYFTDANPVPITVPTGAIMFPDEVPWVSRRWAERRFPGLRVWCEPAAGGHFGALEQPAAVAAGIVATVRACRQTGT